MKAFLSLSLMAVLSCTGSMTDARLKAIVEQRIEGDRTSACVLAAVIEEQVSRAVVCADPSQGRPLTTSTALEIGSVTKTMTAALLAKLIEEKKLTLDDALAVRLPEGTRVPAFQGAPILLKHLVTHTSGLPSIPSRLPLGDLDNPYAAVTEEALLASLGDVELKEAPGTHWAYSNFAVMLLSYVVSRTAEQDFESFLKARLFDVLGMGHAYVAKKPEGASVAQGHWSNGKPASAWDIPVNLAGVGGVRASLDDMVRYAEAQLGRGDAHLAAVLAKTQAAVDLGRPASAGEPEMGMAWLRGKLSGRVVLLHDGGTGGFSSFIAVDPERSRAVVLLTDTSLANLGGAADLGAHLLDPAFPLQAPRTAATPAADLLASLAGRYQLEGSLQVTLSTRDGKLFALPDGRPEIEFGFDSHGDFFALSLDGLLTPTDPAGGERAFVWTQGGAQMKATRLTP